MPTFKLKVREARRVVREYAIVVKAPNAETALRDVVRGWDTTDYDHWDLPRLISDSRAEPICINDEPEEV
jgi:hypothetical protein